MDRKIYYKNKFKLALRLHFVAWLVVFAIIGAILFPKQIEQGMYDELKVIEVCLVFLGFLTLITLLFKLMGTLAFKSESVLSVCFLIAFPLGITGMLVFIPIYKYYKVGQYLEPVKDFFYERKVLRKTVRAYQSVWKRQNFFQMVIVPLILLIPSIGLVVAAVILHKMFTSTATIVEGVILLIFYLSVAYKLGGVQDFDAIKTTYGVEVGDTVFDYGEVRLVERSRKEYTDTRLDITAFILAIPLSIILLAGLIIAYALFILCTVLRLFFPTGGIHTIHLKRKTFVSDEYVFGPEFLKRPVFVFNRLLYKLFKINLVSRDFWLQDVGYNYIESQLSDRNSRVLDRKLDRIERKYGSRG